MGEFQLAENKYGYVYYRYVLKNDLMLVEWCYADTHLIFGNGDPVEHTSYSYRHNFWKWYKKST